MADKKLFQALQISFKDPVSGEEHTGFFVGESFLPADQLRSWQDDGKSIGSLISGIKIIPPADFPDLAAFSELESLLDSVAEAIESASKDD